MQDPDLTSDQKPVPASRQGKSTFNTAASSNDKTFWLDQSLWKVFVAFRGIIIGHCPFVARPGNPYVLGL